MSPKSSSNSNDFNSEEYAKKVDTLEEFRQSFEGKEFDKKVCSAIHDSVSLQQEIKKLIWGVIKDKLFWVISTIVALLFTSFLTAIVSGLADKIVK